MASKREKEFHKVKNMDMMKSIVFKSFNNLQEKRGEIEQQNMIHFVEKHKKLEEQKRIMGLAAENKKQVFETQMNDGIIRAKMKSENEIMRKAQNVVKKHEFMEQRVWYILIQYIIKKEDVDRQKLYKLEINTLKMEELNYNLKKQEKIQDYFREKSIGKVKIRSDRFDEYKLEIF